MCVNTKRIQFPVVILTGKNAHNTLVIAVFTDGRHKRGSDCADVDGRTCWHVAIALHFDSAVIITITIYHHPPLLAPLWALISLKMRAGARIANSSQVKQVVARRVTGGEPAPGTVSRYCRGFCGFSLHPAHVPRTAYWFLTEGREEEI
jgi:hypothetical protein